eukprot:TRINITY_DN23355_c0_g3_i1.p1 TRINITY_DN23355_c0_g3~~TRINITY_DN23355_c0_g3_i1.p1  ORF type:complete len:1370 (-),score=323.55 TRINITY_DN23355_c0_g3_i1:152-4153(-)
MARHGEATALLAAAAEDITASQRELLGDAALHARTQAQQVLGDAAADAAAGAAAVGSAAAAAASAAGAAAAADASDAVATLASQGLAAAAGVVGDASSLLDARVGDVVGDAAALASNAPRVADALTGQVSALGVDGAAAAAKLLASQTGANAGQVTAAWQDASALSGGLVSSVAQAQGQVDAVQKLAGQVTQGGALLDKLGEAQTIGRAVLPDGLGDVAGQLGGVAPSALAGRGHANGTLDAILGGVGTVAQGAGGLNGVLGAASGKSLDAVLGVAGGLAADRGLTDLGQLSSIVPNQLGSSVLGAVAGGSDAIGLLSPSRLGHMLQDASEFNLPGSVNTHIDGLLGQLPLPRPPSDSPVRLFDQAASTTAGSLLSAAAQAAQAATKAVEGSKAPAIVEEDFLEDLFDPDYDPQLEEGEIKARTMHDMVAEVPTDDGVKRVLFLSNEQCTMLSETPNCVDKIMEAFKIEKPQLVIQLLMSNGDTLWVDSSKKVWPHPKPLKVTSVFENGKFFGFDPKTVPSTLLVNKYDDKTFKMKKGDVTGSVKVFQGDNGDAYGRWDPEEKMAEGDWAVDDELVLVKDTSMMPYAEYPWPSRRDSLQADQRLVAFMQEVIIPLAAQTNAVVLCQAHVPDCMLSTAFSKAYEMKKHQWPGKPPFTVIGITSMMRHMYTSTKKNMFYKALQKKISSWDAMEPRYRKKWPDHNPTDRGFDLDKRLVNFIINDGIEKNDEVSTLPFLTLQNELIRQWTNRVPGFSLISGFSFANRVLLPLQGGSQVVFVDQREREVPANLQSALEMHKEYRDHLKSKNTADFLQNETLAYFHATLTQEHGGRRNNFSESSGVNCDGEETVFRRPLHAQIEEMKRQSVNPDDVMSEQQREDHIEQVAKHVVDACFEDIFDVLPDRAEREARGESKENFLMEVRLDKIRENIVCLSHPRMHSVNAYQIRDAKKLIDSLTRVDRVPDQEPLDGLLLLREAWDHYDIKMYLASWYKRFAKILYLFMLLLGIVGITLTTAQSSAEVDNDRSKLCANAGNRTLGGLGGATLSTAVEELCKAGWSMEDFNPDFLGTAVLLVSVVTSVAVSIEGYANASQRWRALRTAALSLESMIWMYRTRVGIFSLASTKEPQIVFCQKLQEWNHNVVNGADMSGTSLEKRYKESVYRHFQYKGGLAIDEEADDFHSPMNPQRYIACRLIPRRKFYESRIPKYVRFRMLFQLVLFLCSATSALLSYLDLLPFVAIVTAVASALTSWICFTDLGRKCERYTNAIRGIKDLERRWNTLTVVQQSDTTKITQLICQGEMVLNNEYTTWSANIGKASKAKDKKDEKGQKTQESKA